MQCPVCQSAQTGSLHRDVGDFEHGLPLRVKFSQCANCQLVFQDPLPDAAQLDASYPTDYRPHVSTGAGLKPQGLLGHLKEIQAAALLRKYGAWIGPARGAAVELGCGSGHFLNALARAGFNPVLGVDREPALGGKFEGSGIRFKALNIEAAFAADLRADAAGGGQGFDFIFMNYVFEHLLHPLQALRQCRSLLKPGGQLFILTPNAASWGHRLFGRYWSGLHAPRHPMIYTAPALQHLAKTAGFASLETRQVLDPASWAFSFQNLVTAGNSQAAAGGTRWYSLLLLPLWGVPALIERMFGRSSSIVARFGA